MFIHLSSTRSLEQRCLDGDKFDEDSSKNWWQNPEQDDAYWNTRDLICRINPNGNGTKSTCLCFPQDYYKPKQKPTYKPIKNIKKGNTVNFTFIILIVIGVLLVGGIAIEGSLITYLKKKKDTYQQLKSNEMNLSSH